MLLNYSRPAHHRLGTLLAAALLWSEACNANDGHYRCYSYLTELVRSSSFPFSYVKKDKANLLIDNDQGETVSAQVVFDTGLRHHGLDTVRHSDPPIAQYV